MGLPQWTMPVDEPKTIEVVDKNSAATRARSTIRRQRTLRGPGHRIVAEERNRRMREIAQTERTRARDIAFLRAERELERLHQNAMRSEETLATFDDHHARSTADPESIPLIRRDILEQYETSNLRAADRDDPLLAEATVHPSSVQAAEARIRFENERHLPTPLDRRTAFLRQQALMERLSNAAARDRAEAAAQMGSPNPADTTRIIYERTALPHAGWDNSGTTHVHNISPEFSPARQYRQQENLPEMPQPSETPALMEGSSLFVEDLPPLRRMPRHSDEALVGRPQRRRHRVRGVDGLGDRVRSPSPEADMVWDTLLTTITPDPQPPSISSSFTSASASASASSLPTTVATSLDSDESTDIPCIPDDVMSDSDSEEDDAEGDHTSDLRAVDQIFATGRDRMEWSQSGTDPADFVRQEHRAEEERRRHIENRLDGMDQLMLESLGRAPTAGALGGMQRIIQRLARREDIPDEWWAEAGLSRTLPAEEAV